MKNKWSAFAFVGFYVVWLTFIAFMVVNVSAWWGWAILIPLLAEFKDV